jgi:hypothetical protein
LLFGIFIYDGVEPIDLATYGVLSMARRIAPRSSSAPSRRTQAPLRWQTGSR